MDPIALTAADEFLEKDCIMTTIHEQVGEPSKQNRGKIQIFKIDQIMYFYFCDENVGAPALNYQFCELRTEL